MTDETGSTVNVEDTNEVFDSDEEEEYECRVCRGPAEEGRPLFSPCKCSGSIGLTHQDCLSSWLAVTRGEGRCELCKVKFHFAPRYAENAPDRLSVSEVFLGLSRSAVSRWLPFSLRLAFCLSLWLVIAPLSTAYLYHIWVKRSLTGVYERWSWQLLAADTVSGAVLMTIVLVSFLSLMSFADFLRVEWQQQHRPEPEEAEGRMRWGAVNVVEGNPRENGEVDNVLLDHFNPEERTDGETQNDDGAPDPGNQDDNTYANHDDNIQHMAAGNNQEGVANANEDENNIVNNIEERMRQQELGENRNDPVAQDRNNRPPREENARPPRVAPRPERGAEANMDMEPPEDQVDMEINVALDELLGLRGPLSSLLRNLLWLLVFNTIYLGFFTFVPRTIGSAVFATFANTKLWENAVSKLPVLRFENATTLSLKTAISLVNEESENLNTIFRLPDFAAVNLGYFFCAGVVILIRYSWLLLMKFRRESPVDHETHRHGEERFAAQERDVDEIAGRVANAVADHEFNRRQGDRDRDRDRFDHPGIALGEAVGLILDATVAVVKVGILLFLKMFLLPVLLGIWLDVSSMKVFGSNPEECVVYAGKDIFSFVLLHWVAGITFMLLVTVSVLQLREVAHADLLAHLIRPQEPQPDLLGNLLHDSVLAQTKRMLLSLGIYTFLLVLHVLIPVQILTASGIGQLMPFLKLKFWYIMMPQLQVPLELLVFHLSMLALLERYKNSIGSLQHHWLVFLCSRLGLSHYMLPHEVEKFGMVGYIPVSNENSSVTQALYELAKGTEDPEKLVSNSMVMVDRTAEGEAPGENRESGERVLESSRAFIALPRQQAVDTDTELEGDDGTVLLPTRLGKYRLQRREDPNAELAIEVWEEIPGKPIPRPPEGWDDLGAGGADIQGRWAWGKEKQSGIEQGVAHRPKLFGQYGQTNASLASLVFRFTLLLLLSWCATTCLLVTTVATPLGIGRLIFFVLRIPDNRIHVPWVFAVGSLVAFPIMARAGSLLMSSSNESVREKLSQWIASMHRPPFRKGRVVLAASLCWFLVCPMALGLSYELNLIKNPAWFAGEEGRMDLKECFLIWMVGTILLNTWACLCSLGVFTKAFWVNLGNGIVEIEGENQRGRQENAAHDQEGGGQGWQGSDGRISKFFAVWKAVLTRWEWDKVDHDVLLSECAIPVSKNLCVLFLAPSLCYLLWLMSIQGAMSVNAVSGILRLYIFRLASASTLLLQLCHAFRNQIQRWFSAVHKTARDDRYLIGEILLNYEPESEQ